MLRGRFSLSIGACLILLVVILSAGRVCAAPTVKITATVGKVSVQQPGSDEFTEASSGTEAKVGARIRTAKQSKCEIKFPDGAVVRMGARADLLIERAADQSQGLQYGQLYARVISGKAEKVQGGQGTATVKGLCDDGAGAQTPGAQFTLKAGPVDIVVEGSSASAERALAAEHPVVAMVGIPTSQPSEQTAPDIDLTSAYVASKLGDAEISIGRQRHGGQVAPYTRPGLWDRYGLYDGIRVRHQFSSTLDLDIAYCQDSAPLSEDNTQGWVVRAKMSALGGSVGLNYLEREDTGSAIVLDAEYALWANSLKLYGEYGDDEQGRRLSTLGFYFPRLYDSQGLDLFLEHSRREGEQDTTSATILKGVGSDLAGVAKVTRDAGSEIQVQAGIVKTLGGGSGEQHGAEEDE